MVVDVTVKWENKERFINKIQTLDENTQIGLMNCIQNNELLLKLSCELVADDLQLKERDNSIFQILTFNTKTLDNVSQNCSFSNFDKLNLNQSLHINHSLNEDSKDSYDGKSQQELQRRIKILERDNKMYKMTQHEISQR